MFFFKKKAAQFFSKKKNNAQLVGFPAKKIIPFFYIPAFFKQMNEWRKILSYDYVFVYKMKIIYIWLCLW